MIPDFEKAARDTVAHWFVVEWVGGRPRPEDAERDTLIAQIKTAIEATWNAAIEDAAVAADVYAEVNIEAAGDTILMDPILRGKRPVTAYDESLSHALQQEGGFRSSMYHAAQHIAAAIRALKATP